MPECAGSARNAIDMCATHQSLCVFRCTLVLTLLTLVLFGHFRRRTQPRFWQSGKPRVRSWPRHSIRRQLLRASCRCRSPRRRRMWKWASSTLFFSAQRAHQIFLPPAHPQFLQQQQRLESGEREGHRGHKEGARVLQLAPLVELNLNKLSVEESESKNTQNQGAFREQGQRCRVHLFARPRHCSASEDC